MSEAAAGLDLQSTALDTQLDLHPKVKVAIEREVKRAQEKLASCSPEELRAVQARLQAFREILGLPASIRKIEQDRRAAGQDVSRPEDYLV